MNLNLNETERIAIKNTGIVKNMKIGLAGTLLLATSFMSGLALARPPITQVDASQATMLATVQPSSTSQIAESVQVAQVAQVAVLDARSAVSEVGPAVVTIVNTQSVVTGRGRRLGTATAVGSGVIIDSKGYIVTNHHVIENAQSLQVIFSDGTEATARLVSSDATLDLAVVKVDSAVPAVAQFGNSDALEAGQPAIAIGTALGDFRNTVTAGIVSGTGRDLEDLGGTGLADLIQTDASINEGNSGGPLIDISGDVIGINVAVVRSSGMAGDTAEGLGFAIPSNVTKSFAQAAISGDVQ